MILTNELANPLLLLCPLDPERSSKATTNWNEFRGQWISYRLHPDVLAGSPNSRVNVSGNYVYCPYHKFWQLGDRPAPPGGWDAWWRTQNP